MPNEPPFISSSLSLLTELSDQSSASPQAPIERMHTTTPTKQDMPEIKQESFETPHTPNSIPGGNILSKLPFAYTPPTSIKPIVPVPTIAQHTTIMQPLLNEDCIGKVERDCLIMEGIPSEVQVPIQMHLMIKHPDHYPQDPYLYMQVYDTGQFVLPANAPLPTSMPNAQDAIPMLSPPAPSACEQMPMPGTVIKCKYRHEVSSFNDCAFCSSIEHFFVHCLERQKYIDTKKCKVHEEMRKLVLPNGDFISGLD